MDEKQIIEDTMFQYELLVVALRCLCGPDPELYDMIIKRVCGFARSASVIGWNTFMREFNAVNDAAKGVPPAGLPGAELLN